MQTVHLSSRGQIVIPKDVRERYGIECNTDLVLLEEGDALVLRKKADIEKVLRGQVLPAVECGGEKPGRTLRKPRG